MSRGEAARFKTGVLYQAQKMGLAGPLGAEQGSETLAKRSAALILQE
jgi:hypothetical protein